MDHAEAALHLGFGRKTFPAFAGVLEKTDCLDRTIDLPYDLRGCGLRCPGKYPLDMHCTAMYKALQ